MIARYYKWLHGQWPAGRIEKLPEVGEDGKTNVPGIRIAGDLSGIPLLKFSSETGSKAIHGFLAEPDFDGQRASKDSGTVDVAIIGAGVSGVSAAMEAKKAGLSYVLYEASQLFSTVANFPKAKPIYTYPTDMTPSGGIQYSEKADVKEALLDEMQQQLDDAGVEVTYDRIEKLERKSGVIHLHHGGKEKKVSKALRVVVAIGRSGNFRKMGIPGEDLDKVSNRLHDPKDFCTKNVLIVGGGDSAMEAAIALAVCGSHVTLSYRGEELSRPKPENIEKVMALAEDPELDIGVDEPTSDRVSTSAAAWMRGANPAGSLTLALGTEPTKIEEGKVTLKDRKTGEEEAMENDAVFAMIGREAPLDFFRRSGINITGDRNTKWWVTAALSFIFFMGVYLWKGYDANLNDLGVKGWDWPGEMRTWIGGMGDWWQAQINDRTNIIGTIAVSMNSRSFYYTLTYCMLVLIFGIRRINRRKTPYVTRQTIALNLIQWIPLFLLPEIILPWLGYLGAFPYGGFWDGVFEPYVKSAEAYAGAVTGEGGHPRAYWRAYGLILAWPLSVYNIFTDQPFWIWITIGVIQTFVLIPWMIRYWGKGAYCGWICSCGALAETVGDKHRQKMPHGPFWNKLNMIGQVFLFAAFVLLIFRIIGWMPLGEISKFSSNTFSWLFSYNSKSYLTYGFIVDILFAGTLGVAFYFHLSGRVWCRFACPLAALMHIYTRFSKFRIFPEKKKCISCNVCTSVCHQGIDIMNFANKGIPMEDPECVRCSACVQQCPTGVLSFGREKADGEIVFDTLPASLVQMAEKKKE